LLTLPVVAGGKPCQMLLDVLVRGLHEGEAAAGRSFAPSYSSWWVASASL
jgi:hypothetical protein